MIQRVQVRNIEISNDAPLVIMAGPCQIETRDHALETAEFLQTTSENTGVPFIYKSSFDKANRTSLSGRRGVGIDVGLRILEDVQKEIDSPVMTDVHTEAQCAQIGDVVDIIQIPAFLCRQTDLLIAAAKTGKALNVKKGQFLAPWDMIHVAKKIASTGNKNIMLCERGTSFGYNTLVVDVRGLPIMAQTGYPVIMDATHAVQQPGGQGVSSGGQREFAPVLSRAAVSIGVAGVFMETHEDPDNAPSDGPNMIHLHHIPALWRQLKELDVWAKNNPAAL